MTILNSLRVPKILKGGPLGIFKHLLCSKISKKIKGGTLWNYQKNCEKKSHSAETIQVKNTQVAKVGFLSCFQGSGFRFSNLGWGSKVCGIIWSN